jgi:hypothetical protein
MWIGATGDRLCLKVLCHAATPSSQQNQQCTGLYLWTMPGVFLRTLKLQWTGKGLEYTCKDGYRRYSKEAIRGRQVLLPSLLLQVVDFSGGGYARCPEGLGPLAEFGAA